LTVCAWCERFLGQKDPGHVPVSHGICPACAARQAWSDGHTLVVPREKEDVLPVLEGLLRGTPEIQVVLDRRRGERRGQGGPSDRSERRSHGERRRGPGLHLA
jgi:hypothetical protein